MVGTFKINSRVLIIEVRITVSCDDNTLQCHINKLCNDDFLKYSHLLLFNNSFLSVHK